ncbi:unnamed protein product [Plasmodium vivax]|uniref:(malaria parasite P. vivax) hypothetical protein n=1 Tax=Plasmodium vivax TaxID=5855 RepID=A0A8S4H913_PLAVI|nr:unnamed protein product [Plasmodium vivax]
MEPNGQMYSAM